MRSAPADSPMLIVCPSCASEYTIDPTKLGADGRTVRCALCRDTWFAGPVEGASSAASAPEPGAVASPPAEAPGTIKAAKPRRTRPHRLSPRNRRALAAGIILFMAGTGLAGVAAQAPEVPRQAVAALRALVPQPPGGLGIEALDSEVTGAAGERVLRVSGMIVNPGRTVQAIPHLEFLVRSGDEQVLAAWTSAPPRLELAPGEAVRFEERFPAPAAEGREIRVQLVKAGVAVAARTP